MRAVQFDTSGGPEVLHVAEIEEPHAGPGQVRIAVKAAGLNPWDHKQRAGLTGQATGPVTTALEASGVVDEVGEGVSDVAVGDEVFGAAKGGAAAEYTVLTHWARKPAGMSFEEAGGLTTAVEAAQRALDTIGLKPGDTVVVNGAAGGVGQAAVQLARAAGAGQVIGTASESNHDYLRSLGAVPTTYGEGLADRLRELCPDGVDLALDTAGAGALPALIAATGDPQKVVTIASPDAADHGVHLTTGGKTRAWDALGHAAELYERGEFRLPVAQAFPFEEAAQAHRVSEGGHVRGKLVLVP